MSERITITIETGNAAFEDNGIMTETARILRHIAKRCEEYGDPESIKPIDANGNTCGSITVKRLRD